MPLPSQPPSRRSHLAHQPWFLVLLSAYAVLELSFNHRLLVLAADPTGADALSSLRAMEQWARVVSGLGLALLLVRWLDRRIRSRLVLVLLSATIGLVTMWHLQKALVDAIVASAHEEEMRMSVHAVLSTPQALHGRIALAGQEVLTAPARGDLRRVMGALWPSSVLGLSPEDLEPTAGAVQMIGPWAVPVLSEERLRSAYRRVVMTPVALGASLLFGLLNLCQLLAALTAMVAARTLPGQTAQRLRPWVLPGWVVVCASLSWWPANAWVDSPGYRQVAQPALWQHQPMLAPFVEWSLRAELAWSDPVAWVHRQLMADYDFRAPLMGDPGR